MGLEFVGARGLHQAVESRAGLGTPDSVGKQAVAPAEYHHAVILPISGRKLKSTILGNHFTADAYELITANDVCADDRASSGGSSMWAGIARTVADVD
jgi:hypothetical protein